MVSPEENGLMAYRRRFTASLCVMHRVSAGYKAKPKCWYYASVGTGLTPGSYLLESTAYLEEDYRKIVQKNTPVRKREVDEVAAREQLAR